MGIALRLLLRTPLGPLAVRRFLARVFDEHDDEAWRAQVLQRADRVPRRAVSRLASASFGYDSMRTLRVLRMPVLYVKGNGPTDLSQLPTGVRVGEVSDAGHWIHVHAPDRVNASIEEFLTVVANPVPSNPSDRELPE